MKILCRICGREWDYHATTQAYSCGQKLNEKLIDLENTISELCEK